MTGDKLGEWSNAHALRVEGIVGDGVADDTAALQRALDAANAAHRPPAPTFDDLMRVLFFSPDTFFLDCQECAVWTEVQAAFPEQFAQYEREYAQVWQRTHPGRAYPWRTKEELRSSHDG